PGIGVDCERMRPTLAAVGGAIDTALGTGAKEMPERGHHDYVGAARIDPDPADVAGPGESERPPRFAAIGGLEDSAAGGYVISRSHLARTHVEGIRRRRRHGERPDGRRQVVAHGAPGPAG